MMMMMMMGALAFWIRIFPIYVRISRWFTPRSSCVQPAKQPKCCRVLETCRCWVHAVPLSWREPLGDMLIKAPAHGSILLSDWLLLLSTICWSVLHQAHKGLCRGGELIYFIFFNGSVIFFLLFGEYCWFIHSSLKPRALLHSLLSMSTQYQGEMSHAASSACVSVCAQSVCFPLLPERAGMRASGGWESTRAKAATEWKPKAGWQT